MSKTKVQSAVNEVVNSSNGIMDKIQFDQFMIDPRNIVVAEDFNARADFNLQELKESIKENGIKNPIAVIPFTDSEGNEKYRLVDGERRYRSVMSILSDNSDDVIMIPALFLSEELSEKDLIIEQLTRNEGKNFNEWEYGVAIKKLIDLGYSKSQIEKQLGFKPWRVSCYIAHLNRDERVQKLMKEGRIAGPDVRRIYQAHKDDEQGAVKEILKAAEELEGKPEEKITVGKLNKSRSKTVAIRDTATIRTGLKTLFQYYKMWLEATNNTDYELDIVDIFKRLEENKNLTINELFEGDMCEGLVAE